MAITYKFLCTKCKYQDDIYVGNTKMQFMKKLPEHTLGSCLNCGKLFSNTERICELCKKSESSSPNMNTFKRIKNWLFNKPKPLIEVRFYGEGDLKEIPCPKCNYKYLIHYPIVFSD